MTCACAQAKISSSEQPIRGHTERLDLTCACVQAKISSSEQQIRDLTERVEQLERLNEQLSLRARDLEVANQAAAQNAALSVRAAASCRCFCCTDPEE